MRKTLLLLIPILALAAAEARAAERTPDYSRQSLIRFFRQITVEEEAAARRHNFRYGVADFSFPGGQAKFSLILPSLPGTIGRNTLMPVVDPFEQSGTVFPYTSETLP